jgi:hypothetical protein
VDALRLDVQNLSEERCNRSNVAPSNGSPDGQYDRVFEGA